MRRVLLALLALVLSCWAANLKLYLKDGSFHIVREYQVETDRVRFYSVERSQWEEIPLDLVDLKRTQSEAAARQEAIEKEAKIVSVEEKIERQIQEVSRIPQDPGVYWLEGKEAKVLKQAESTVHTNKGRSVLRALAPVPIVSGKATLELAGAHSATVFSNPEQEFYIQLSDVDRFGIVKLSPGKGGVRIVETMTIMPVTKEVEEQPELVDTFQKQLSPDGLYKIWPKQPLAPGEYAVVEYLPGKLNMQVLDFAIKPAK